MFIDQSNSFEEVYIFALKSNKTSNLVITYFCSLVWLGHYAFMQITITCLKVELIFITELYRTPFDPQGDTNENVHDDIVVLVEVCLKVCMQACL